jgi:hypothetical protein
MDRSPDPQMATDEELFCDRCSHVHEAHEIDGGCFACDDEGGSCAHARLAP